MMDYSKKTTIALFEEHSLMQATALQSIHQQKKKPHNDNPQRFR